MFLPVDFVVMLPTDSHRGVPEYGRWQGYPFDFSLCAYVPTYMYINHKYEVTLAWDVTASFFDSNKPLPLLNSARYDCLRQIKDSVLAVFV